MCLPIPPHLSHLASPLQKVTSPPQKSHPHPRSVCMLTPLVSFRVLSILSQTVTGVVSSWLHFLQCGTPGSSGKQDGAGGRDAPSARAVFSPWQEGARSRLPEVEQTLWYHLSLSAGRKSSPGGVSGQVSWQLPPHPHPCPS